MEALRSSSDVEWTPAEVASLADFLRGQPHDPRLAELAETLPTKGKRAKRGEARRHPRKASVSELDHGFFFEILASYFKNDNNYLKRTKTISAAPLNTLKIPKRH